MVLAVKRPEIEPPNSPPPTNKNLINVLRVHISLTLS